MKPIRDSKVLLETLNLVFRLLQDFDEAHDIAQETFIRAHDKLKGFRGESTPYTWLYRIALNLSLNHMRKKKLRAFFSLDSMATQDLAAAGGPERDLDAARNCAHRWTPPWGGYLGASAVSSSCGNTTGYPTGKSPRCWVVPRAV
jgi:hypothetical protein